MATAGTIPATAAPTPRSDGISLEVLCAVFVVALAVLPLLFGLPHDTVDADALLPLLVWPVLGMAGLVVLDRRPGSRRGWACVLVAPIPASALGLVSLVAGGDASGVERFARAAEALGPVPSLVLLVPGVVGERSSRLEGLERSARRWRWWTSVVAGLTCAGGTVAWWALSSSAYGVVTALGVGALAAVVVASALGRPPRPVLEPVVDVLLVVLVLAAAAVVGLLVLVFARVEQIFAPSVLGGLAATATMALAGPTALWVRRELDRRRYGSGVISPDDVEAISRELDVAEAPRALLERAAASVAGVGGVAEARLLLDEASRPGWTSLPLEVTGRTVGTLLVRPRHPEGLEERQLATITKALPTLALAARAVALAVDADHARRDAEHQRELERARILADLHDDLGPVLVGMGLRVEALRVLHPSEELTALASDLAGCRADLRRIVEGLTPPVVADHDLATAISRLTRSLDAGGSGPEVRTQVSVPVDLGPQTAAVAYRIVAEAVTNAVRHGRPALVEVSARQCDGAIEIEVRDDGHGAVVVPGQGLTSLRARAEQLGGELVVQSVVGLGTTLRARLPEAGP